MYNALVGLDKRFSTIQRRKMEKKWRKTTTSKLGDQSKKFTVQPNLIT